MQRLRIPAAIAGLIAATTVIFGLAGCGAIKTLGYLTAPANEKIPAEYSRLAEKKVLVYVWVPPETMWDYPKIRVDLAASLSEYLEKNVEKVIPVNPLQMESFLEKGSRANREPEELAKQFGADVVIHVSIYSFSIRDPGMAHFYRGRLNASVTVHETAESGEDMNRIPLKDVSIIVPEKGAVGFNNATPDQVRQATYDAFTVEVGHKFHGYDRPLD